MMPKRLTAAGGLALLVGALPAAASCDGTVARRAADGATFVADSFGYGRLAATTRRGLALTEVDIWRGKVAGQTHYMHAGGIGIGFGSTRRGADYRGRIKWQPAFGFPFGGEWDITAGPLRGKWSSVCDRGPAPGDAESKETAQEPFKDRTK